MTTPRSPMAVRKLGETSFEADDEGAKVPKMDVEPPWSVLLASMQELKKGQDKTNNTLASLVTKVEGLEERVAEGETTQGLLVDDVTRLKLENATLRGMVHTMRADLDQQIDRDLRDHLIFYGVSGTDKTWEETALRLGDWLATNIGVKTRDQYDQNIWRAHRGPYNPEKGGVRPIFAKISYRYAEFIHNKLKINPINGVSTREQYSPNTQARVNEALAFRKDFKAKNVGAMSYISYPAVVKVKCANDTKYRVEKSF